MTLSLGIADSTIDEGFGGPGRRARLRPFLTPMSSIRRSIPIPYARPNGLSAQALRMLLTEVAARHRIVGVEITAFHSPDDAAERDALGMFLIDAVTPLLRA